jgi:hypothetical protein
MGRYRRSRPGDNLILIMPSSITLATNSVNLMPASHKVLG